VIFHSQGVPLAGRFIRRGGLEERQAGVIVMAPGWRSRSRWRRSTRGGSRSAATRHSRSTSQASASGGEPRQTEIPSRKTADIAAAVGSLQSPPFIAADRVALLGICASAQDSLAALAAGVPVRSFASVAGWYHNPVSVAPFYGGEEGVQRRLTRAREAFEAWSRTRRLL